MKPLYPNVEVKLQGEDGNPFMIASRTRRALERAGHREQAKQYFDEVFNGGDYDHVIQTTMKWVNVT